MCKCSRHTTSTKSKDSEFNSVNTKELDDMITYRKTQVDQIVCVQLIVAGLVTMIFRV